MQTVFSTRNLFMHVAYARARAIIYSRRAPALILTTAAGRHPPWVLHLPFWIHRVSIHPSICPPISLSTYQSNCVSINPSIHKTCCPGHTPRHPPLQPIQRLHNHRRYRAARLAPPPPHRRGLAHPRRLHRAATAVRLHGQSVCGNKHV